MRRSAFLGGVLACAPVAAYAQMSVGGEAIALRFVSDEADAVLAILDRRASGAEPDGAQWNVLFSSEGYRRLGARERSMQRPFEDAAFRAFVTQPELVARRAALASTVAAWRSADVSDCGRRALAYLPPGSRLRATVYAEIKPQHNSFVYDLERDPGIFLYVDPDVGRTQFTYTVAHELHHVGFAQNCPTPAVRAEIERLAPPLAAFQRWLSGFGEGFAVLAGAGGPDVNPATVVGKDARAEWDDESTTFASRMAALTTFFRNLLNGRLTGDAIRDAGMTFFGNQGPWYTVGWRMAVTIERRLGRARLIDCIADNRRLLATYNEAAGGTALPRWPADLAGAFNGAPS